MRKLLSLLLLPFLVGFVNTSYPVSEDLRFSPTDVERGIYMMTSINREKGPLSLTRAPVSLEHPRSVPIEEMVRVIMNLQFEEVLYPNVFIPLAIARHETGFRNLAGDHHLGGGVPVSCGLTQIRTDFDGRPACSRLLKDPTYALTWTHNHLNRLMRSTACTEGGRCLSRYAGAGPRARAFETWLIDVTTAVMDHLEAETEVSACLPLTL